MLSVLDVGTGSGCIACTLALDLPGAQVTAWDVSQEALAIAADNASRLGADIVFQHKDILHESEAACNATTVPHPAPSPTALPHPAPSPRHCWDIIVSNPPYICESERQQMERHIVDHEPALALFVPDDDALRFYRAIGLYGLHTLRPGGCLFLELNAAHADETATLLQHQGYADITVRRDQFGRQRLLKATRP